MKIRKENNKKLSPLLTILTLPPLPYHNKRRQKHSGALSRSQQSPQLMDIDQFRNYEQTWSRFAKMCQHVSIWQ